MKKSLMTLSFMVTLCLFMCSVFTGCSSDDDNATTKVEDPVTVKLEAGEATETTITVTSTPSDDNGNYYVHYFLTSDITSLTNDQLVSKITSEAGFDASLKKGKQTNVFKDLTEGTSYTIVAFGYANGKAGSVARISVSTAKKPIETIASNFFDVDYWGDFFHTSSESFIIRLGDCPHEGLSPTGTGKIYNFAIYNSTRATTDNPLPQMGTYVYGKAGESVDMAIETSQSLLTTISKYDASTKEYAVDKNYYTDAKLTISDAGNGNYKIEAYVKLDNGEEVNLEYTGKITYRDKSFKGYKGPNLEKDVEFTAIRTSGNYTNNGQAFTLFDNTDDNWDEYSKLEIWLPSEDQGYYKKPPVGTFYVNDGTNAGKIIPGEWGDLGGGGEGYTGTNYFYFNSATKTSLYGWIVGGSVTISKDESTGDYTIVANLKTNKGHTVKATYKGPFPSK